MIDIFNINNNDFIDLCLNIDNLLKQHRRINIIVDSIQSALKIVGYLDTVLDSDLNKKEYNIDNFSYINLEEDERYIIIELIYLTSFKDCKSLIINAYVTEIEEIEEILYNKNTFILDKHNFKDIK